MKTTQHKRSSHTNRKYRQSLVSFHPTIHYYYKLMIAITKTQDHSLIIKKAQVNKFRPICSRLYTTEAIQSINHRADWLSSTGCKSYREFWLSPWAFRAFFRAAFPTSTPELMYNITRSELESLHGTNLL